MPVYQREVCANGFIAYIVDTVRIFAFNFFALTPIYIVNLDTLINEPFSSVLMYSVLSISSFPYW